MLPIWQPDSPEFWEGVSEPLKIRVPAAILELETWASQIVTQLDKVGQLVEKQEPHTVAPEIQ